MLGKESNPNKINHAAAPPRTPPPFVSTSYLWKHKQNIGKYALNTQQEFNGFLLPASCFALKISIVE